MARNQRCWSLSNSEGVSARQPKANSKSVLRCWSLSNSEGVSALAGGRRGRQRRRVLVAFKQRRCFSPTLPDTDFPIEVLVAFKQRRCFS